MAAQSQMILNAIGKSEGRRIDGIDQLGGLLVANRHEQAARLAEDGRERRRHS
jgi:hypothetical protein